MRAINLIVVHCTATRAGQPFDVASIRQMHKARGFSDIGYHFLIGIDGDVWTGRPLAIPGAHVAGHNARSIGISYVGGLDAQGRPTDTRTDAQRVAMRRLLTELGAEWPHARITGHRDLSPDRDRDGVVEPHEWLKACPCFDTAAWCRSVGIDPA